MPSPITPAPVAALAARNAAFAAKRLDAINELVREAIAAATQPEGAGHAR